MRRCRSQQVKTFVPLFSISIADQLTTQQDKGNNLNPNKKLLDKKNQASVAIPKKQK